MELKILSCENFSGKDYESYDFTRDYDQLDNNNFAHTKLLCATFEGITVIGNNFSESDLRQALFRHCQLNKNNFSNANLQDAEFNCAKFIVEELENLKFQGAKLQGVEFSNCDFWEEIIAELLVVCENDQDYKELEIYCNLRDSKSFMLAEYDDDTRFSEGNITGDFKLFLRRFLADIGFVYKKKRRTRKPSNDDFAKTKEAAKNLKKYMSYRLNLQNRAGQKEFRNSLLKLYQGTCAITGYKVPGLEAAHIKPYSVCDQSKNEHTNSENGLLLRADVHTLFDLDLIRIKRDNDSSNWYIEIDEIIEDSPYKELQGKPLYCISKNIYPGEDFIKYRQKNYQNIVKKLRDYFSDEFFNY